MSTPPPLVALAGNPNTGKTTLFNRLTGARAKVGNYPGVTVETVEGKARLGSGGTARILDVPGAYSLSARSAEEQVAIRAVAGLPPFEAPDAVVVVVDATQLTRNLYLCLQIIELGLPVVVALTMVDAVERKGQRVDVDALARELGVRVVPVVAHRGDGTDELRAAIDALLADPSSGRPGWRWRPDDALLERDLAVVREHVPDAWLAGDDGRRDAFALWALLSIDEGDELDDVPDDLRTAVASRHALARASGRDVDREVIGGRYGWIDARAAHFFTDTTAEMSRSDRVDRVLLHPVAGFALFLALMTVLFQSLFAWADPMITAIEEAFSWIGEHAGALLPAGTFHDLVVDGLIGGVGGVLVFLPQILLLFLFIGIMEDTGYMARVAFLMDRIMKSLGLHGRGLRPDAVGLRLRDPRGARDAHDGAQARPALDDDGRAADDVQRTPAGLLAPHRGDDPGGRRGPTVHAGAPARRDVPLQHARRARLRRRAGPHGAEGPARAAPARATALPPSRTRPACCA